MRTTKFNIMNAVLEAPVEDTKLHYEEDYHAIRHASNFNHKYYEAKAYVAKRKYFDAFVDKGASVLDYGCGMGQNILYVDNAQGYDISEYALDFARSKGIKATNNINSIADNSMDVVFSAHVLEHHTHPYDMIAEIRSKLKPGGKLVLVIPHERHGKADFKLDLNQHLFMWNFQNINNLLMVSGFEIKKNKYMRGAGYNKLLDLYDIDKELYRKATKLAAYASGIKELLIIAEKK